MDATAQPEYLLTKSTFVCLTDGALVFLDLHNDRYSCLESRHTGPVARLLGLPPLTATDPENAGRLRDTPCEEDVARMVQDLIDRGLVTQDPDAGKRAEFIAQNGELRELLGYEIGEAPKIRAGHVLAFFKALIVTKSMLRFASIERIVTRVKRRKERHLARGGSEPDAERINELVEIYKILKPLFVTVKDNCLFNSLFLIEFLAQYGVCPTWYFGVRLNEFYAHCWVQGGNVIYDDFIQTTCQNQPIMAV
ncbi:MAG: lasso peptide biosynthesis B2 protein [Sphingomonadales bacterium]|nr:lasso peptide biosynthesis B2 protein [Sphingomonadales bacterium]